MLVLIDSPRDLPNRATKSVQKDGLRVETPFGAVNYEEVEVGEETVIVIARASGGSPKSLAYAARALGGTRVVGVVRDSGVARPFTPSNYIEFTSGRPTTFFETIGTGYVQQNPPFCPELRQALMAAGAADTGNLLILDELPEPDVRTWWLSHQVSLISTATQPEGALCRELELCYAVLALPESAQLAALLPEFLAHLPTERQCGCDQLMSTARKFGKLSADWFQKL